MKTIKEIEQRMQTIQATIAAETQAAQAEREKATQYRMANDPERAQAHENTAMKHEQKTLQLQSESVTLMNDQQAIQAQITDLDRQKDALVKTKDDELARLDTAISNLRGQ